MNLLFINPTRLDDRGEPLKYAMAHIPPLSLAILHRLTPEGHRVTIVNDIVEEIDFAGSYDLVAITAMTVQAERAYQIADRFRGRGVAVVIGGFHATVLPDEAGRHADAVVVGEAETLWARILEDAARKKLKKRYRAAALPDLREAVIPRWDGMNLSIYPKMLGAKMPFMPIFTTRGCPYGCSFCSVTKFYGKSYRTKPVEQVMAEIDATGAEYYFFVDDNIVVQPHYSRELFTALCSKHISWLSQISTTVLNNPDLIDLAARSGCTELFVGVESVNEESLGLAKKGFNKIERYSELISRLYRAGISPTLSFIFGFDSDSPDQFGITLDFLKKMKVNRSMFWVLTPFPGTDLFAAMEREGRIEHYRWSQYDAAHVVFRPRNFSRDELTEAYWRFSRAFYSYRAIPRKLWNNIKLMKHSSVRNLLVDLVFQPFFSHKISQRDHPYSGGLGRRRTGV